MKEIKFRAWDKEKGKMFNVDAIFFKDCYMDRFTVNDETIGCEIGPGDYGEREIREESNILMQYTGLKDKNGVEIYEGDIVRLHWEDGEVSENEICTVTYGTGCFNLTYTSKDYTESFWYLGSDECEVIGNIYENPELDIP